MILQALKEYYDRKAADPESNIAPLGLEWKPLEFLIVIDNLGTFISIEDLREKEGKKLQGKKFLLPRSLNRQGPKSYCITFLLWDHLGYLLGLPKEDPKALKQHKKWKDSLTNLPDSLRKDSGVNAVLLFYKRGEIEKALKHELINECLKSIPCNMAFRINTELMPIPSRPAVLNYAKSLLTVVDENQAYNIIGNCIISGEKDTILNKHGKTPINKDNNSLISFQKNSGYDSYRKLQAFNAPVGRSSEFAYITALNTLLKSQHQKFTIADSVCVCWSEKKHPFENGFSLFFDDSHYIDDPDSYTQNIKNLFKSIETDAYFDDKGNQKFFVLGLTPGGGSRIAVRFWQVGTVSDFAEKIRQHFEDLNIIKPPKEMEYYSIWRLLVNIATLDKSENIPPNIGGDFMRAILNGTPYPTTLLQATLRRIRSDTENRVKPVRAALVKAYLNRYYRFHPDKKEKEIGMALDIEQPSIGYQLGRLFAVLEKIQEEANPGLNATIRERYYGAACSSPVTVFANLLRLKNHHLAKLENKGRVVTFELLLGEIVGRFNDFPSHLDLHEQGKFAIGYYHQQRNFYTKNINSENLGENNGTEQKV